MARGPDPKLAAMERVPLFEHVPKKHLKQLASMADEIDLPAGHVLMREGERGRECVVVLDGAVDVTRKGKKVALRGGTDVFGEIALLCDRPRVATVTARTPLRVLVLTDRHFKTLVRDEPTVQAKVMQALAERVAVLEDS